MTAIPKMVDIGAYPIPHELAEAARKLCAIAKKHDYIALNVTTINHELESFFVSHSYEQNGHHVHFRNGAWHEYEWRDGVSDE